jgi:hypothetical protein
MGTDTIDHATLQRLAEAGAVRAAAAIGQPGGWGIVVKYGMAEHALAAQRGKKVRVFRKLETVVSYLKSVGISRFEVDTAQYEPNSKTHHARPDRAQALRQAHEAAAHDRWFREQVETALKEADRSETVGSSHEEVMERLRSKLDEAIAAQAGLRAP